VQQIPVSPGFGGRLTSPDNAISAAFPPGAVAELAVASYRAVTETLPTTRNPIGPVFDLGATWYGGGDSVRDFLRPVTITVWYNESDMEGVNESRLALHYWDDGWIEVPTIVEAGENRAAAGVNHFTIYALLEWRHTIYLPLVIRR